MVYVNKIRMKKDCHYSNSPIEIDELHLIGLVNGPGWYKKATVHDYIKYNNGTVRVYILPYPELIPMVSSRGEKYVKSVANSTTKDNLMNLPRE